MNRYLLRTKKTVALALASGLSFFVACGDEQASPSAEQGKDENAGRISSGAASSGDRDFVSIPISMHQGLESGSFGLLAAADTYEIDLESCSSGYAVTVTEADGGDLEVYEDDRNCLAKLTTFTYGGRTYVPTAGDPFTTWQAGDYATFDEAGEPGVAPLRVSVVSTLQSPVSSADTISYGFVTLAQGQSRSILWSTVGASDTITVGVDAPPSFTVTSIALKGSTANEGGKFEIVLECTSDMGITNVCETVDLIDMDYKLVEDTYGDTLTTLQADTIFSTAGTDVVLPDDRVAPGDSGTTNGGMITAVLDGPDDMALHPNMMLILRSYDASYQYFNIDVSVSASY